MKPNKSSPSRRRMVRRFTRSMKEFATRELSTILDETERRFARTRGRKPSPSPSSSSSTSTSSCRSSKTTTTTRPETNVATDDSLVAKPPVDETDPIQRLYQSSRVCEICYDTKSEHKFAYSDSCSHVVCKTCLSRSNASKCSFCNAPVGEYLHVVKQGECHRITIYRTNPAPCHRRGCDRTVRRFATTRISVHHRRDDDYLYERAEPIPIDVDDEDADTVATSPIYEYPESDYYYDDEDDDDDEYEEEEEADVRQQ